MCAGIRNFSSNVQLDISDIELKTIRKTLFIQATRNYFVYYINSTLFTFQIENAWPFIHGDVSEADWRSHTQMKIIVIFHVRRYGFSQCWR